VTVTVYLLIGLVVVTCTVLLSFGLRRLDPLSGRYDYLDAPAPAFVIALTICLAIWPVIAVGWLYSIVSLARVAWGSRR
jgi:hypothetical protein